MNKREFLLSAGAGLAASLSKHVLAASRPSAANSQREHIHIDLGKRAGSLPHFWENCAGSDRTAVGLRDQWRRDLQYAHRVAGIKSVRSHGLFDDEMGIASAGAGKYNFLYVDQIYDFMLDNGVRPFVELSFMPEGFASSSNRVMAYKANVSPPANWEKWSELVNAFTAHCVKRYGIAEVSQWQFEVWNEPNILFWAGTQAQYFELFRRSVQAVKAVDRRLRVGGPATAQLEWIPELINYCASNDVPLDFVSSHIYPSDPQRRIFGRDGAWSFEQVIPRGIDLVNQQIKSSARPDLPLLITEWSSLNPAFIAQTVNDCIGKVETLAYWTFSNVFEEGGVPAGIFNDGFGLIGQWGIPRPALHAFAFLHRLGEHRLTCSSGPVLATERADGSAALLVWNLIPAAATGDVANGNPIGANAGNAKLAGTSRTLTLKFDGLRGRKRAIVSEVNESAGSAVSAWQLMGSPQYPTPDQLNHLRAAAALGKPRVVHLSTEPALLTLELPANGVALIELES